MTGFEPRRLGHVNLWVSDLERAITFFEHVCGIPLVRRERSLIAGFHSNGYTHHDLGMIEVSRGKDRVGKDGAIQIPKTRGVHAGLNHLGWEMEDEVQLVDVFKKLKAKNLIPTRLSDNTISNSVYVNDPDGNMHEFYADTIPDWRTIFNLEHEDLVTSVWDPELTPPKPAKYYPVNPKLTHVPDAPLRPMRLTGAAIATTRFDGMAKFFDVIGGLHVKETRENGRRQAVLSGRCDIPDLTLFEVAAGEKIGLRTFAFMLDPETDFDRAAATVRAKADLNAKTVHDDERKSLVLDDPDKLFRIEFYLPKGGKPLPARVP